MAERARIELELADGGRQAHHRREDVLTAQEAHVAPLALKGLSNPEIAARLVLSTRMVQYHLSKVFMKLGISFRGQLHRVLHALSLTATRPESPAGTVFSCKPDRRAAAPGWFHDR